MADFFQHPMALVESDEIGDGTRVWAFAHVMSGARIGRDVNVGDHAFVETGAVVGDNVTIKNAVCIWDGVTIQNDVFVGPRVTFTNDRFPRSPRMPGVEERYAQKENWLAKTLVQQGASIGACATITPGVTLGFGCTVGAGAIVVHDVQPFALVVGTPARQIGDVCQCGGRLDAAFDESDCKSCGQTAIERAAALNQFAGQTKIAN